MKIKIKNRYIGDNYPTYFIADIGANHDGSLQRAKNGCWESRYTFLIKPDKG